MAADFYGVNGLTGEFADLLQAAAFDLALGEDHAAEGGEGLHGVFEQLARFANLELPVDVSGAQPIDGAFAEILEAGFADVPLDAAQMIARHVAGNAGEPMLEGRLGTVLFQIAPRLEKCILREVLHLLRVPLVMGQDSEHPIFITCHQNLKGLRLAFANATKNRGIRFVLLVAHRAIGHPHHHRAHCAHH